MKIPKEFEDVFRGVDLTEGEIRTLTWIAGWESRTVKNLRSAIQKAQDAALSALRPVSWEGVEKAWRGYWDHNEVISNKSITGKFLLPSCECSLCGCYVQQEVNFCPYCGAPMTDEAVEMVLERLEKLKNEIG